MNLFPITMWHSTFIDHTRKSVSNWKQNHLNYDASNFYPKPDSWKFHPWKEKNHSWMKVSSVDVMEKCHPWMSSVDGEMSFIDGERPSMDGNVIRGCHPWMTLLSMDHIHRWRRQMTDMDGVIITWKDELIRWLWTSKYPSQKQQRTHFG